MPLYQFTVTAGSTSALRKKEIAEAITKAHCRVTGAPESYVNCTFVEVPERIACGREASSSPAHEWSGSSESALRH